MADLGKDLVTWHLQLHIKFHFTLYMIRQMGLSLNETLLDMNELSVLHQIKYKLMLAVLHHHKCFQADTSGRHWS